MFLIDRKGIEDGSDVLVSVCPQTETLALRIYTYLLESGLPAKLVYQVRPEKKDTITLVECRVKVNCISHINFALYLLQQWGQDA